MRPFKHQDTAAKIYKALIEPYFNYSSGVWDGLSQHLRNKLQKLQNLAARIFTKSSYDASAGPTLDLLGCVRFSVSRTKQKHLQCIRSLIIKCLYIIMQNMFSSRKFPYNVRNSVNILQVTKPRTSYMKRSFGYSGAVL